MAKKRTSPAPSLSTQRKPLYPKVPKSLNSLSGEQLQERLRILDHTKDLITVLAFDTTVTYASPSHKKYLGYSPRAMVGKKGFQFIHPDDRSKLVPLLKKYVGAFARNLFSSRRQTQTVEYRILDSQGGVHWLESIGTFMGFNQILCISRDITERKKMEVALRESEEKFRAFITDSAYGYCEYDPAGNITYINQQAVRIAGYPGKMIKKMNIRDFIHPEDLPRALHDLQLAATEPNDGPRDYRLVHRSGEVRNVEINTFPLQKDGRLIGFQSTLLDVTDRKRSQQRLLTQSGYLNMVNGMALELTMAPSAEVIYKTVCRNLRSITGAFLSAIVTYDQPRNRVVLQHLDAENRFLQYVSKIARITIKDINVSIDKYPAQRIMSQKTVKFGSLYEYTLGSLPKKLCATLEKKFKVGDIYAVGMRRGGELVGAISFILPQGTSFPFLEIFENIANLAAVSLLRRQIEGKLNRLNLELEQQVTSRTGQLRESELKWRSLVQNIPDIIMTVAADGTLLAINRTVSGITLKEAIGQKIYRYIEPQHVATVKKCTQNVFRTGQPGKYQIQGTGPDHRISWYETRVVPVLQDGKVTAVTQISTDITERKRAEEEMQRTNKFNETILQTIPFGMAIVDTDHNILYMSAQLESLIGKNALGKKCYIHLKDDKKQCRDCPLAHQLEIGKTHTIEIGQALGGRTLQVSHTGLVYEGKKAVLEVYEDITQRKWAEREIRKMTDDLFIVNSIHNAVNRGGTISDMVNILNAETKKAFDSHGATLYLLNEDRNRLVLQNLTISNTLLRKITGLLGITIPSQIEFSAEPGTIFHQVLQERKPLLLDKPRQIERMIIESGYGWVPVGLMRRSAPLINKLLVMRSIIAIPLYARDIPLGLLDISANHAFTVSDVKRLQTIAGEVTVSLERKLFENALTESEKRYKELAELLPQTVFEMDADGNITFINATGLKFFGLTEDDLDRGIGYQNLLTAEEQARARHNLQRVAKGEKLGGNEYLARRRDGTTFPAIVHSAPVLQESRLTGFRGIIIDISARKEMENIILESEARYRSLVERAGDGITIIQDQQLKYVNPRLAEMSGYTMEELIGTRFTDYIHIDELPRVADRYQRRMRGEAIPSTYETVIVKKDTSRLDVELNAAVIAYQGQPADLVLVRDITERKKMDRRLRDSLKEKEVLLNEIHHRVKNNLQVITSLLNLQSQYIQDPRTRDIFNDSKNRVRSMALIHEKLYQSQELSQVDFADYSQSLTANLFRTYGADPARVRLELKTNGIHLDVDTAVPCGLMINELVSNALKYAFPEGRSGILAVRLENTKDGQYLLTVADNGVGLPPTVDFRHTPSLGLQLVCTLTDQLNGTIDLDRTGGAAFHITFPRKETGI